MNLAQVGQLAGVGRAAVGYWRQSSPDFPLPVGYTDTGHVFDRAAVEAWLLAHRHIPDCVTPSPAQRAEARLTGLQLVRALMPGVLARAYVDTYEEQAPQEVRATLALVRDYSAAADTLTEIVPVVLELGYLTASGLVTTHAYDRDRVSEWIAARTRTAQDWADQAGDVGAFADLAAVDVARIAVEAMWVADRDALYEQHAQRAARRLWREIRAERNRAERLGYELAVSAGWLTAHVLASALGGGAERLDEHLGALAQQIIDQRGQPA